jgi:hypothetical protein
MPSIALKENMIGCYGLFVESELGGVRVSWKGVCEDCCWSSSIKGWRGCRELRSE